MNFNEGGGSLAPGDGEVMDAQRAQLPAPGDGEVMDDAAFRAARDALVTDIVQVRGRRCRCPRARAYPR